MGSSCGKLRFFSKAFVLLALNKNIYYLTCMHKFCIYIFRIFALCLYFNILLYCAKCAKNDFGCNVEHK